MKFNLLKILLFAICFIFISNSYAQQTFQQSDIIGKKWKKGKISLKYTNTKEISIVRLFPTSDEYYLSNTIDTVFDKSKVGKSTNGRYIISRYKWGTNGMEIYEILVLTNSTLIVKTVPEVVRIGGDNNGVSVWHTKDWKENESIAQQTFQQSDIIKRWKTGTSDKDFGYYFFHTYTNTGKFISGMREVQFFETDYYLSDNVPPRNAFDESKIDKNTRGDYIIYRYGRYDRGFYKILSLTDDKLILEDSEHIIYIFNSNEHTFLPAEKCKKTVWNYENFTQQTFQKSDIVGKKWKQECPTNEAVQEYYLSDTTETVFDKSKVGKDTNGKYIIVGNNGKITSIYEILKLTDDRLIIKDLFIEPRFKGFEIEVWQPIE